ncbi:50S ribosomal protein L31 [Candidatus Berkelbacteria bacterium]|nr:50S ribosomal protein L31 [Candidatus Berkelbacteria bacterium]MBI4029874.1 50S ribosomal protein L31 [Candidatus Berkelbacteria bacterium]
MQKIHPTYYNKAKVKCLCGHQFEVGSTRPEIEVEICAHCHPFYQGKDELIDIAGRVDKFKAKLKKTKEMTLKNEIRSTKLETNV